jgi:thioredoxin-like negative regulator of GroEL
MKPIVDGLEQQANGELQVIRLDLLSQVGRGVAQKYGVWAIPMVILFNSKGQEVKRQMGFIKPAELKLKKP